MTRKSRRELEHALETLDELGLDTTDIVDLAGGWSVAFGDEEPPERDPVAGGAGYEIYAGGDEEVAERIETVEPASGRGGRR